MDERRNESEVGIRGRGRGAKMAKVRRVPDFNRFGGQKNRGPSQAQEVAKLNDLRSERDLSKKVGR